MDVMPRTERLFGSLGTTFSEAYATIPSAARRGRRSSRAGSRTTTTSENAMPDRLEQEWTMQRYLEDAGYQTAIFGRYLNSWTRGGPPLFDRYSIGVGYDGSYYPM